MISKTAPHEWNDMSVTNTPVDILIHPFSVPSPTEKKAKLKTAAKSKQKSREESTKKQ